jgi:Ca2+-binding EF-hand superfamily protein
MEKDNKGLVNKLLEAQYYTVFKKFDKSQMESLDYDTFKNFLYAIGLEFLNEYYADEVKE